LASFPAIATYAIVGQGRCDVAEPKIGVDEIDDDAERRAIEKARDEIAEGKGVPHEKVREWLQRLRDGKVEPAPCA
jgi:hypothetical protein